MKIEAATNAFDMALLMESFENDEEVASSFVLHFMLNDSPRTLLVMGANDVVSREESNINNAT